MTKSDHDRRRPGLFSRLTEPLAERTRERIEHVEDWVRQSIQSEIDSVSRSVRARAVEVRPSALAFASAALFTVFGLALFVTAAVVALHLVLELWAAALIVGATLILLAAGLAAWGRHRLPAPVRVAPAEPGPAPRRRGARAPVDRLTPGLAPDPIACPTCADHADGPD